jgi:hypothetical protein
VFLGGFDFKSLRSFFVVDFLGVIGIRQAQITKNRPNTINRNKSFD